MASMATGAITITNVSDGAAGTPGTPGTPGAPGASPSFERSYTTTAGLLTEIGNPTTPGTGVSWTSVSSPFTIPSTAFWVAERFTINSVTSDWQVYPVQAKDGGIPFVTYTITRTTPAVPTLNDAQWITDAIEAVEDFTGRDYTNQKEFGYGTVVVITYIISGVTTKLSGIFKRVSNVDTWVAAGTFIDGDLFVDGTVAADKLQANSIDTTRLVVTGTNAVTAVNLGGATAAQGALAATANQDSTSTIQAGTTAANVGLGNVDNDSTATIQAGTTAADVGLGNVDNNSTSTIRSGTTATDVGLGNVDNDSTATIQAGTTAANVGLGNVNNTSDATNLAAANAAVNANVTSIDGGSITTGTIDAARIDLSGVGGGAEAWAAGSFSSGDQVYNNGNLYVATATTTAEPPGTGWLALVGGNHQATTSRMTITSEKIEIYENNNLRVVLGKLA